MTELKQCPFCGGEAEICSDVDSIMGKYWYIRCKKCYCHGTGIYESGRKLEPQEEHAAITGAWEKAIEAWNRRVTIEPDQQWIPCSERLPEEAYPVIVTWKNDDPASYYQFVLGKHYTGVAHYKNGKWFWYSSITEDVIMEYGRCDSEEFDEAIKVLAWMPLPEPYEGDEK